MKCITFRPAKTRAARVRACIRLGLHGRGSESAVPARPLRWLPELIGTSGMRYDAFHGAGMRKTKLLAK